MKGTPHVIAFVVTVSFLFPGPIDLVLDATPQAEAQRRKKRRKKRRRKPKPRTALVQVTSLTEGATIYIDEAEAAVVPMEEPIELAPGEHTIKVSRPGYADFFETIDFIPSFEVQFVEADLFPVAAIVRLTSEPAGARVLVDGEFRGDTPFDGEVDGGTVKFQVTQQGYLPWVHEDDLVAGETYLLEAKLALVPEEPIWETWWFWTGVGAVALSGAVLIAVVASGDDASPGPPNDGTIDLRELQLTW